MVKLETNWPFKLWKPRRRAPNSVWRSEKFPRENEA